VDNVYGVFGGMVVISGTAARLLTAARSVAPQCTRCGRLEILLRAAGWAQERALTSSPEWGHWYCSAPYGDAMTNGKS
jgi:hypothetical protein